jgi:hypothetical protein
LAGLVRNSLIYAIDDRPALTLDQFVEVMASIPDRERVSVRYFFKLQNQTLKFVLIVKSL